RSSTCCAHRPVRRDLRPIEVRDRQGRRLEPLLPAGLLRCLHCLLSTFRHCCPPSHEIHGGCRISAAANRPALHSDYYSTIEKTATPLNETCTRGNANVARY